MRLDLFSLLIMFHYKLVLFCFITHIFSSLIGYKYDNQTCTRFFDLAVLCCAVEHSLPRKLLCPN